MCIYCIIKLRYLLRKNSKKKEKIKREELYKISETTKLIYISIRAAAGLQNARTSAVKMQCVTHASSEPAAAFLTTVALELFYAIVKFTILCQIKTMEIILGGPQHHQSAYVSI